MPVGCTVLHEFVQLEDLEDSDRPAQPEVDLTPNRPAELPKIIPFSTLARCGDEVWIETEGQVYRLRRTRQGKLILTK